MEMIVTKAGHGRRILRKPRAEGDVVSVGSSSDQKLLRGLGWAAPQPADAPRAAAAPKREAPAQRRAAAAPQRRAVKGAESNPAEPAQPTVPAGGSEAPKRSPNAPAEDKPGEDPNPGEPAQPTVPAGEGKAIPIIGAEPAPPAPAPAAPATPKPDETPEPKPRPGIADTPAARRAYARRDMQAET